MTGLVPWNASWTGEQPFEVRPCRWADGQLALWQPHRPGVGQPIFAKPHMVRQRFSVMRMICTVCGVHTPPGDRWWFALGEYRDGYYMTTAAPVHRACAEIALKACPHLRANGCAQDLTPFPAGYTVMGAVLGGEAVERDFGVKLRGRTIIGAMKFAWPQSMMRVIRREGVSG